jgi:hypothetical protein
MRAEHTGPTSAPDRCPRVRTKTRSPDRFRLVKVFTCGARPPHPINIKGHDRLRNPIDQNNLLLYFYFFSLPFNFSLCLILFKSITCYSSFVSTLIEGVLGGLADPRATLRALPRRDPARATFGGLPQLYLTKSFVQRLPSTLWLR